MSADDDLLDGFDLPRGLESTPPAAAAPTDPRDALVRIAQRGIDRAEIPEGHDAVMVVTDPHGAWVGVSATCDARFLRVLLESALANVDERRHET